MESDFNKEEYSPTLREAIEAVKLPGDKLVVGMPVNEAKKIEIPDRHSVLLLEGDAACGWQVPSLRELFRGDKVPPVFGDYPDPDYDPCFYVIEWHMIMICDAEGVRTDKEFLEVYSAMRRRPDGRSLGTLHDFLWQASALLLGMRPLSALEFEAIMGRLALSARHFSMGLVSRNYITHIRPVFPSIE
jgi:hypothetical protein